MNVDSAYVKFERLQKYATVEFHNPKGNALSSDMLSQLTSIVTELGSDPNLNVILIKSVGSIFCAGAFFDELLEISDEEQGEQFFMGFGELIWAIKTAKPIVIIEVQGKAIGGAVGLIAAADYVIASESAQVRLSELTIGIGPFVISPVIKSKISIANFMHLALNPKEWFDVKWCVSSGLVNEFYSESKLSECTSKKVEELSEYSTEALQELKASEALTSLEGMKTMAKVSGRLVNSSATKAVLETFLKK